MGLRRTREPTGPPTGQLIEHRQALTAAGSSIYRPQQRLALPRPSAAEPPFQASDLAAPRWLPTSPLVPAARQSRPSCPPEAVLARYLPGVMTETLGWDGHGRQRAETAIVGRCTRSDDTHLAVDIRVRVVPYHRIGTFRPPQPPPPRHSRPGAVPASAPAPTALGWEPGDTEWVRLAVPVTRNETAAVVIDLAQQRTPEPAVSGRG